MPPAHVSVARIAAILESVFAQGGGKTSQAGQAPTPSAAAQTGNIEDLIAMFPGGVISGQGF